MRYAIGVISKPPVLEHVHKRKIITASAPTNDHTQIRFCTFGVCKQQDYAMITVKVIIPTFFHMHIS